MPELSLDHISQSYGAREVVRDLSMRLLDGEIGCLLGASGCGKTTVLRCIAGFEPLTRGEIRMGGEALTTPNAINTPVMAARPI